jgi:hypothetical protein
MNTKLTVIRSLKFSQTCLITDRLVGGINFEISQMLKK